MNIIGKTISDVSIIKIHEGIRSIQLCFNDGSYLRIDPQCRRTIILCPNVELEHSRDNQITIKNEQDIKPQRLSIITSNDGLCGCRQCLRDRKEIMYDFPMEMCRMVVCEYCGNKRCPRATDHRYICTQSNEPGQKGSVWENIKSYKAER